MGGHGGEPGGADDVDEQHRHAPQLAAQPHFFGGDGHAGDIAAHLAAEEVADPLALAQPDDHLVEPGLQLPELGAVVDGDVGAEIALLDPAHRLAHGLDGVGHRPRRPDGDEEPGPPARCRRP